MTKLCFSTGASSDELIFEHDTYAGMTAKRTMEPLAPEPQDRRSFLWYATRLLAAVAAAMAAFGGVRFVVSGGGGRPRREVPKHLLSTMEPGSSPEHVASAGVWIARLGEEDRPLMLDDRCTHLGCRVKWDSALHAFRCPCHGSEFETSGAVRKGPATKPLTRLFVQEEGAEVVIVSEKAPGRVKDQRFPPPRHSGRKTEPDPW